MVTDLRALLTVLALSTPAVLVGWSLSALLVQLYACTHPADVAGLVLLDPTPDSSFTGFLKYPPAIQEQIRSAMLRNSQKMGGHESFLLEVARMPESCEQVRCAVEDEQKLPNVSLVVITAGVRAETMPGATTAGDSLTRSHQHIAQRALRGQHIVAERSSHRTMTSDEPELIVESIRSVLRPRNNS